MMGSLFIHFAFGFTKTRDYYLHVYCSMRSWHHSHCTSQHHLNLQRHCHRLIKWWILWPRPQHNRSQLSRPCAVSMHGRSTVPNEPVLKFRSQYCGDGSKWTNSKRFGVSYRRRVLRIDVVRSPLFKKERKKICQ